MNQSISLPFTKPLLRRQLNISASIQQHLDNLAFFHRDASLNEAEEIIIFHSNQVSFKSVLYYINYFKDVKKKRWEKIRDNQE